MRTDHLPPSIRNILEKAILAPSSHNSQPWKFTVDGFSIHIFPDFQRRLEVADPEYRELIISLGCALENLVIAARHEGFRVRTSVFPEGEDGIFVELLPVGEPAANSNLNEALYAVIPERQTTRRPFDGKLLPPEAVDALANIPLEPGVHLRLFTDRRDINNVVELVRTADELLLSDRDYQEELLDWLRFSRRTTAAMRDGLTAAAAGRRWVPDWLGRFFVRHFFKPEAQADADEKLLRSASAILLFHTDDNDPVAWVKLGRTFERVALTLTRLGLKHAHHNQPTELPGLRPAFHQAFGESVCFPQLLVRIGYAEPLPPAPRRKLEEVIA